MKTLKILEEKIALRIASCSNEVFMRKDFDDIADYDQIGRGLRQLVAKGTIIKIGYGLYAKAGISPLSNRIVPRRSLRDLATEVLQKLKVEVVSSSLDQAYNQGKTTQVPTGRVIGVKGRVARKIGYDGKYITFEHIT